MSERHREAVLIVMRHFRLSVEEVCELIDEEDRPELADFLSGKSLDIDIDPLGELAHALGVTMTQLISAKTG